MNKDTNNIFSFFIEKALGLGDTVAFIVPKSLIGTPEFNKTREVMNKKCITHIVDYGDSAFKGVRIETISFVLQTDKKPLNTAVESYINGTFSFHRQDYIADSNFPYWLIYRNDEFDSVAKKMQLDIFTPYRDRKITKAVTKPYGLIRVLKSRNIGSNKIIDIAGYDCYVDDAAPFAVSKYMNKENCVLLPNLSYAPRACFLT